jgi:hypothetical protein
MPPHPHPQETNIPNIEDVAKMGITTWKQTLKLTPMTQCNVALKPSCGSLEISTCQKEKEDTRNNSNPQNRSKKCNRLQNQNAKAF